MSWCDKLASVPSAGFSLDWHFATSNATLDALSPLLDPLVEGDKQLFNITRQDAFSVTLNTQNGFVYGIEPSKIFVGFFHSLKAKSISGGPPIMQMLSSPLPYTELLVDISKRLIDATLVLPGHRTRKVTRVGIVTNTTVDEEGIPPGIARFLRYVGRPWGQLVGGFSFQITAQLDQTSGWDDKCVHALVKQENPTEPLTLTFDWQRTFAAGQSITPDSLKAILSRAEKDAVQYFEELAEGTRFDDDLIGTTG